MTTHVSYPPVRRLEALVTTLLSGSMLWTTPPAGAGVELFCTYNADTKTVRVEVPPVLRTITLRRSGDAIVVSGTDCGEATRFNTDRIVVMDAPKGPLDARIDLAGGEFRPGATDEPGASDEIEFAFFLRGGANTFRVQGLPARGDDIQVGENRYPAKYERRLNLNAAEQGGVDIDARVEGGLVGMTLSGRGGRDHFDGDGGETGAAYAGKLTLLGHSKADFLEGGRVGNEMHGGKGPDVLVGWKGFDTIFGELATTPYTGAGAGTPSTEATATTSSPAIRDSRMPATAARAKTRSKPAN